jgi:hypothetical protein
MSEHVHLLHELICWVPLLTVRELTISSQYPQTLSISSSLSFYQKDLSFFEEYEIDGRSWTVMKKAVDSPTYSLLSSSFFQ